MAKTAATSSHDAPAPKSASPSHEAHKEIELSWFPSLTTYFGFGVLILVGWVRDSFGRIFGRGKLAATVREGYAPLLDGFAAFYVRRMYRRVEDAWNTPIATNPGRRVTILERDINKNLEIVGQRRCINLSSYNYLGFANPQSPCVPLVLDALEHYGVATCSPGVLLGSTAVHKQLEDVVAKFLSKESVMLFGMGFGVNATVLPAIAGPGTLVVSDTLNHSSIVFGCRSSGAKVATFEHNDAEDLERVVREAIVRGHPRTRRPWKKIWIVVEGVYSMEGHTSDLAAIVAVKNKYGCYLFVDEAHSIGALGRTGRGITEYAGVDPADVDILMGTFTKSFGSVGGYIASSRAVVDAMKRSCASWVYSQGLNPACAEQAVAAFRIIMGETEGDLGRTKLKALHDNANYFRREIQKMGVMVLGAEDSPVVPMMIGDPAKISAFLREGRKHNLAVVVVGFPATPILASRVRFCISAAHTREDLEEAIASLRQVIYRTKVRYVSHTFG